ncbi:MAG: Gfo/Idh/MocA family oxidoreductase [Candidatus Uhrbacteria bacterium]|nr:Gfo/Idh/MocA family oxidoreductase [Candidatus Uhrbacteria bacterium]
MKIKVIGAGSIGNHLSQACRRMGWEVMVVDRDEQALKRMKEEIYPKRYGAWDEAIQQFTPDKAPKGGFDVMLIGTPPDFHLSVATAVLRDEAPRVLQIEKPLCSPTLEGMSEFLEQVRKHPDTKIIVGFNHLLSEQTVKMEEIIKQGLIGQPLLMDCEFRSHWKNIFDAHPWLKGPQDTYLGYWKRGGGAGGEHAHGISMWQHAAHLVGAGRVTEVGALVEYITENGAEYDRTCFMNLKTENGLVGRLIQDVITLPKKKFLQIQGTKGSLLWDNDVSKTLDQVSIQLHGKDREMFDIAKSRTDEFFREIQHIDQLLNGATRIEDSPIRLQRALDTMAVLAAAHQSEREKRVITVDYAPVTI